MFKTFPVIHEKVVIAQFIEVNPVGEALKPGSPAPLSPMLSQEREAMIERLENSILTLMDETKEAHQTIREPNHITRLSTNEFFFYTKEPLTLKEFEELQNKIADRAKTIPEGVH